MTSARRDVARTIEVTLSDEDYRALARATDELFPHRNVAQFTSWYLRKCLHAGLPLPGTGEDRPRSRSRSRESAT